MTYLISKYKSYYHRIPIIVLTAFQNFLDLLNFIINSFLLCTVEVWGPKRFVNKDEDSTKDFPKDRLYRWLLNCKKIQEKIENKNLDSTAENNDIGLGNEPMSIEHFWPFDKVIKLSHKNQWIQAIRTKESQIDCYMHPFEKITFTSSRRNRSLIYELIKLALKEESLKEDQDTLNIYKPNDKNCTCCDPWEEVGKPRPKRPRETVILADGVMEKMISDLKSFINSQQWYMDREIPYRRGYLLYGPPGCGKSSLVRALASELNYGICILSLSSKDLTDFTIVNQINRTPEKCIILIEDLGAAFQTREDEFASSSEQSLAFGGFVCSKLTFSGLLNALDGVAASENRIIFMTTNHIDRLDPALLRPGRIDVKVNIGFPTDNQLKGLFKRFYPSTLLDCHEMQRYVDKVRAAEEEDDKVSMAMMQGLFVMCKDGSTNGPTKVFDFVEEYFREQKYLECEEKCDLDFYN